MSYIVLARRYRPRNFEDIVGQEPIVATLKNAIRSDRVAHAYLLAGPRGVGKTSTARILSKALNCQKGPTVTPCNVCDICRCISEGNDIDVIEIDGASNRGIDEVRDIRKNVGYTPSRSRYKVYIIDEVHMLTREAFNALLKTLEEPPHHVKFIFATTAPNRLPETVQSRCQRFDFKNISIQDIEMRLSYICNAEGLEVDPPVLYRIARYARGSLRDAQSVLDQLISFCKDKITTADVDFVIGSVDEDKILALFESFAKGEPGSALRIVNDVLNEGKTPAEFIDQLLSCMRDLLVFTSCGQEAKWIDYNSILIQRYGKAFLADNLMYMIQILMDARTRTTDSLMQRILLEMAMVRLTRLESMGSLTEIAERIASLEDKLVQLDKGMMQGSGVVSMDLKEPAVQQVALPENKYLVERSQDSEEVKVHPEGSTIWGKILLAVQKKKKSTWALLREGQCTGFSDGEIVITFPGNYSFHKEKVDQPEEKKYIEKCAEEVVQGKVRIKFIVSKDSDTEDGISKLNSGYNRSGQHTDVIESQPLVKKTLELFGGYIIKSNRGGS